MGYSEEYRELGKTVSNWGRWGDDDERAFDRWYQIPERLSHPRLDCLRLARRLSGRTNLDPGGVP